LSKLSFKIGQKKTKKSILFYHLFDKEANKGRAKVFKRLAQKIKGKHANVLYILDHLQEKSLAVFKKFLNKYAKMSNEKIKALKYKKLTPFK